MAHVIKDSMNHYAIEIKRGTKKVQCLIRYNGEVEFKTFPLAKTITDNEYHSNDGTFMFDERWKKCGPEQDAGCTLDRVLASFRESELAITDKAHRMMEALRANPNATEPLPFDPEIVATVAARIKSSTINPTEGDTQMSTKTKKSKAASKPKKANGAAKPKADKGYKGHRVGSRKEAAHKFFDEKKPDRQEFIAYCEKHGLKATTASSWFQGMKK